MAARSAVKRCGSMKPLWMWLLVQPHSVEHIEEACPRLGDQDVMVKPWNMLSKSHGPPAGRLLEGPYQ
jgi:hypothetical protein